MKGKEWSVHEIAGCRDCSWVSEDRNAKQHAAKHHMQTGHTVTGERGLAFCYDARGRRVKGPEQKIDIARTLAVGAPVRKRRPPWWGSKFSCRAGCGFPVEFAGDLCGECACEDDGI